MERDQIAYSDCCGTFSLDGQLELKIKTIDFKERYM
jgi:hypothetical protein